MSKYVIVKLGGFQYTIEEGRTYSVPHFEVEEGKDIVLEEVYGYFNGDSVEFGSPTISKKVVLTDVSVEKGEKIVSKTFKAKSRYRKTKGFRKQVVKFTVKSI